VQLQSGARLGPYEIVERVGAGGMGEVYRARDTRLGRNVAIKILPSRFASDARLRARFDREAKTISALNHPHVCTLHDVGREEGLDYLVLEYCEGVTLAQRLERGPLPVEQVLQFGSEIADALSRAHRAGIVHRDLKPSNVMITKSGVKLLDFGVARPSPGQTSGQTDSFEGRWAGTIGYIAPEVLAGSEADGRSDIFALGAVLYEMLTGMAAFQGSSAPGVMAAILEREPEPLPRTSPALAHVIEKCLTKNPDERWESAHDIAEELRWLRHQGAQIALHRRGRPVRYAAVLTALVAVAAAAMLWMRRPTERVRVSRLSILLPAERGLFIGDQPAVAISPDGRRIAWVSQEEGTTHLYVRHIDSFESVRLDGTEFATDPFFSPDGQWIGFGSRGALKKVSVAGGNPVEIYSGLIHHRGATWARDGTIFFSPTAASGIWKVSSNGGTAVRVTEPDVRAGESSHRWPEMLPDGRHLLFTIRTDQIASFNHAKIALLSLDTATWRVVIDGGVGARFALPGHLVFSREGSLHDVPFDLRTLSVQGQPRVVLRNVATGLLNVSSHFAVAGTGDLVYAPGPVMPARTTLLKVNRKGEATSLAQFDFNTEGMRVSPDGRKIAMSVTTANNDIWVHDLETGVTTRFSTEAGDDVSPVWTPDGTAILYRGTRPHDRLLLRRTDGRGDAIEFFRSKTAASPSFSPSGDLLYAEANDLWLVPARGERKPRLLVGSKSLKFDPQVSPDGRWVAYNSNESGEIEVYVRAMAPDGVKVKVSNPNAMNPRWSGDGRELYYRSRNDVYGVRFDTRRGRAGKPERLFSLPRIDRFDVSGDHFVVTQRTEEKPVVNQLNVITNWTSELR
jgi:Tol biopolymer transport system component